MKTHPKLIVLLAGLVMCCSVAIAGDLYYSASHPYYPPLPSNPHPELSVIVLGNGKYMYDDTQLEQQSAATAAPTLATGEGGAESFGGGSMFSLMDYSTNLYIASIKPLGANVQLIISNAAPNTAYDVYFTPNFKTNFFWRLLLRGATNPTVFLTARPPGDECYFLVGTANDTDEDGLTDAFEVLVTKTSPTNAFTVTTNILDGDLDLDNDGVRNYEEFFLRTSPYTADSQKTGISDGKRGGTDFAADGVDNNHDGIVDNTIETNIIRGPNYFSSELLVPGKLRGDNQVGITNFQLLLPFVVYLAQPDGTSYGNGTTVVFSATSPTGANISSRLSVTTTTTGANGRPGQAQTYLTLSSETGTYHVFAQVGSNTYDFVAETVTPLTLDHASERYEAPRDTTVVLAIDHLRFTASGGNTNRAHVVGVKLTSASSPTGIISALYESYAGSGVYVGSVKTDSLLASGEGGFNAAEATGIGQWAAPDGVVEEASADYFVVQGSNAGDSDQFDYDLGAFGATLRGNARSPYGSPWQMDKTFLQAAGFEQLTGNALQILKFDVIENQADFLYISTHGLHDVNKIYTASGQIGPESFTNRWNKDLDMVFIAGCSVLDVTGNKWPSGNTFRPGKKWITLGPCYLMGYEGSAPGDSSGIPRDIVDDFAFDWELFEDYGYPSISWMYANSLHRAWNACALDACSTPRQAHHFVGSFGSYTLQTLNEGSGW